jgi:hypothetical protein
LDGSELDVPPFGYILDGAILGVVERCEME